LEFFKNNFEFNWKAFCFNYQKHSPKIPTRTHPSHKNAFILLSKVASYSSLLSWFVLLSDELSFYNFRWQKSELFIVIVIWCSFHRTLHTSIIYYFETCRLYSQVFLIRIFIWFVIIMEYLVFLWIIDREISEVKRCLCLVLL